jgi:hypothetical protein
LEAADDPTASNWVEVSRPAEVRGQERVVTFEISEAQEFFRLRRR